MGEFKCVCSKQCCSLEEQIGLTVDLLDEGREANSAECHVLLNYTFSFVVVGRGWGRAGREAWVDEINGEVVALQCPGGEHTLREVFIGDRRVFCDVLCGLSVPVPLFDVERHSGVAWVLVNHRVPDGVEVFDTIASAIVGHFFVVSTFVTTGVLRVYLGN